MSEFQCLLPWGLCLLFAVLGGVSSSIGLWRAMDRIDHALRLLQRAAERIEDLETQLEHQSTYDDGDDESSQLQE